MSHVPDDSPRPSALEVPSASAIRDELEQLALQDLLGPRHGPEEELVGQRPRNRYLVGTLAPQRYRVRPEELDAVATAGDPDAEEGADEAEAPSLPTMMPSSIGLSFAVTRETQALRLTVRWGRYLRTASETRETETGRARRVWKREPVEATSPTSVTSAWSGGSPSVRFRANDSVPVGSACKSTARSSPRTWRSSGPTASR